MEYLADVLDLADGANQHCDADAADSDQVTTSALYHRR
jgi:hypothetical protein